MAVAPVVQSNNDLLARPVRLIDGRNHLLIEVGGYRRGISNEIFGDRFVARQYLIV